MAAPVPNVTEPLVVVTPAPPLHVVAAFGVAASTSPAGKVSTRSALNVAAVEFAFDSVIVSVLATPAATLAGENAFAIVGGATVTVSVASADAALLPASVCNAPIAIELA